MKIERTHDVIRVWEVMTNPELWATVAEDDQDPNGWAPDVHGEVWLLLTVNDIEIGVYQVQVRNAVTVEIHANMLPAYRKRV